MSKYKILFSDLDGTLIDTISGKLFPEGIWDMHLKFSIFAKIKELKPSFLFIVSNQGGIEKGFVNEHHFCTKLGFIVHSIEEYCDIPVDYYYCSSNDKDNENRKPNYGMLEDALTDYDIKHIFDRFYKKDLSRSVSNSSGLGLTITRIFTERMNGNIYAYGDDEYLYIVCSFPIIDFYILN